MSGRVLALLVLLVAPALAGCVGMSSETEVFGPGRKQTLEIEAPEPHETLTRPVHDPLAPPVFHDGAPQDGIAFAVRETERTRYGAAFDRYACGGAVLAIPEDAPDPRKLLPPVFGPRDGPTPAYVESRMVTDGWGREWTTDLYHARQETTNTTWPIWVANVFGGLRFTEDAGRHCAPFEYAGEPFNVIVHAWNHDGAVDLYYSADRRFPAPATRAWVIGPLE